MNMNKIVHFKNRGSALPLALIAIVLLLTVGTSILSMGLNGRIYSIRNASDISARCAADAGLTKALYEMNQKLQRKSWFGFELPSETKTYLSNCDATFDYTVTWSPDGYIVQATGNSGQAQRTVSCLLRQPSPFDAAIFSDGPIILHNSGIVDWYNYDSDDVNFKVATNSTKNGSVSLKNSSLINGDVTVGPGGDPDEIIELKGSAKIEGETSSLTQQRDLELPIVPSWLKYLPSGGTITNNTVIYHSGKYSEINLKNSKKITVVGDVILYITGDLTLGKSAELEIEDDSSLTLYLGGDLESKNSSKINNETQIPKNLQIYGLEGCDEMDFKNSSDFYGTIYAPNADIVIHNSVDIYGSTVCNSFDMRSSGKFMYDASLRDDIFSSVPTSLVVTNWREY
jgi:hypothetical protein